MEDKKRKLRSIYLNDDEYKEVSETAKKSGFTFASYVRVKILKNQL